MFRDTQLQHYELFPLNSPHHTTGYWSVRWAKDGKGTEHTGKPEVRAHDLTGVGRNRDRTSHIRLESQALHLWATAFGKYVLNTDMYRLLKQKCMILLSTIVEWNCSLQKNVYLFVSIGIREHSRKSWYLRQSFSENLNWKHTNADNCKFLLLITYVFHRLFYQRWKNIWDLTILRYNQSNLLWMKVTALST